MCCCSLLSILCILIPIFSTCTQLCKQCANCVCQQLQFPSLKAPAYAPASASAPMSHYISSFLIDPVVRQARRFSRSSYTTTRPLFNGIDIDELTVAHDDTVATITVAHEIRPPMTLEDDGAHLPDVTGDFEVLTHESEAGALEAELQDWTRRRRLASPLRRAGTAPEVYSRSRPLSHYTRYTEIGTSNNPLYGEPDSFRSDRSSVSGSVSSATDPNMIAREDPGSSLRTTAEATVGGTNSYSNRSGDGSLPADDGMGHMRNQIQTIQKMDITNTEKARFIHELMTERYSSLQTSLQVSHLHRPYSPASLLSSDRPITPVSTGSIDNTMQQVSPPTPMSSFTDPTNPFHLTLEDLRPTYFSKRPDVNEGVSEERRTDNQRPESSGAVDEPRDLGCSHYKRNIKLQCSACDRWYTCRFCHDEVEDHLLNRRETKNMLCMLCGCAQSASEACIKCEERAAWYYCSVCKLWDDDPKKSIYHCNDCGICRVGQGLGKDFYHCKVWRVHWKAPSTSGFSLIIVRLVVYACQFRYGIRIAASSGPPIAIAPYVESICLRHHGQWYSCVAATASINIAITNI